MKPCLHIVDITAGDLPLFCFGGAGQRYGDVLRVRKSNNE